MGRNRVGLPLGRQDGFDGWLDGTPARKAASTTGAIVDWLAAWLRRKDGANEWTIVGEMVGRDVTVGTGSEERGDTVRDGLGWAGCDCGGCW